MAFDEKTWVDAPEGYVQGDEVPVGATPVNAAGLNDLETRIAAETLALAGSGGGLVGDPFALGDQFTGNGSPVTHVPTEGGDGYVNGPSCYFHGSEIVLNGDVIADTGALTEGVAFLLGFLDAELAPPFKVVTFGSCFSYGGVVVEGLYVVSGTNSAYAGLIHFNPTVDAADDGRYFTLPNIHALLASAVV